MELINRETLIMRLNDFMLQESPIDKDDDKTVSETIQECMEIVEKQPEFSDSVMATNFLLMIHKMEHALGLDVTKMRKGATECKCYRNYFFCHKEDKSLERAVHLGFVSKKVEKKTENAEEAIWYTVTNKGKEFLGNLIGITIKEPDCIDGTLY